MQNQRLVPCSFGEMLKDARKRKHVTQQQLAQQLGVHTNTISSWELGSYLPATRGLVLALARYLVLDESETRQLLEASLTALTPSWLMPLPRNSFFTGREEVLEALHTRLGSEQSVVINQSSALHGLGGVGKTQVALEYAYRYALEYNAVFWVGAETIENIVSSFLSIAEVLQLPERHEQDQQQVVTSVQRWFAKHGQWLLIWDNLDDLTLLDRFLPASRQGAILITTRCQAIGTLAWGLDLLPMEHEEGRIFLLRRAKVLEPEATEEHVCQFARQKPEQYAVAARLVTTMGGLPLALDQAGAYIEETGCSLADYLHRYEQQHIQLLDRRGGLEGRNHPLSAVATFRVAIERIEREQRAAADLLRVCALLHAEAIPEELFVEGARYLGPELKSMAINPEHFDRAVAVLRSFSLVQRQNETRTLSLHRLVQAVSRELLSTQKLILWLKRLVVTFNVLFPQTIGEASWFQCERFLPHVLAVVAALSDQAGGRALAELLHKAADYLDKRGQYKQAEDLYQRALSIQEQLQPSEQTDLVTLLNDFAGAQYGLGKYAQAEVFYQRALHLLEQMPEPMHIDFISTFNGLAELYQEQGKYEQAEHIYEQAWRVGEQMGVEHPSRVLTLNGLARLCFRRGRYKEAEPLYQQALGIQQRLLGSSHFEVASLLHNLATLYKELGKDEQSQAFFEQALHIWEPAHPNTASSLNGLAHLYLRQGKDEQARALFEQARQIWEETLGLEHPNVALVLDGLAEISLKQRNDSQAEVLFKQALAVRGESLGSEHPLTIRSLNGLANLYLKQEQYERALELFEQALRVREQRLGPCHPETAQTLHDLAIFHQQQGYQSKALPFAERALQGYTQSFGDTHFKTIATQVLYTQLILARERTFSVQGADSREPADRFESASMTTQVSTDGTLSEDTHFQAFLNACCELHPRAWSRASDLWQTYEHWVEDQQERFPLSRRAFNAHLKAHGCRADRISSARIWRGIITVSPEKLDSK